MIRLIYDISTICDDPAQRAGLARVSLQMAQLLAERSDLEVSFSAIGSVQSLVWASRMLDGWHESRSALPAAKLAQRVVGLQQALEARAGNGNVAAKAGLGLVRTALRAWNLARPLIPAEALRRAHLFHSSYARIPRTVRRHRHLGILITLYDLIPLVLPAEWFPATQPGVTRRIIDSIAPTDWILAISRSSLNDFCNFTGRKPDDRACVIPLAADPRLFYPCVDAERVSAIRKKYGIPPGRYVLTLSSLAPHKNVAHLARCFCRLLAEYRCDDLTLVLSGAVGDGQGPRSRAWLNKILGPLPHQDRIHFTGYVAEEDLAPLYSGATLFAFPSIYEGFGLPVLEAMQCGLPVVASNTSSLPEVVENAGLLLPPTDEDAWCNALSRLAEDTGLRLQLARAARERAARFSWDQTLADTIAVYSRAAEFKSS